MRYWGLGPQHIFLWDTAQLIAVCCNVISTFDRLPACKSEPVTTAEAVAAQPSK